jgi:hypothetical protein
MRKLLGRWRYLLRHRRLEAELREELESHRAERQRQLEREGIPPSDAEYDSRKALGNLTLAIGLLGALWIMQVMSHLLFEITPTDPITFTMVGSTLAVVGLLACWIPAPPRISGRSRRGTAMRMRRPCGRCQC